MNLDELEKLGELKRKGFLSEEEFEARKRALLNEIPVKKEKITLAKAYGSYWLKSFNWKGRATRKEFWFPVLINYFILSCFALPAITFFAMQKTYNLQTIQALKAQPAVILSLCIVCVFQLILFFPHLSVLIRRLHDINKSGIWVLIFIGLSWLFDYLLDGNSLPSQIMGIILVVFCLLPGTKGENLYGPER